MKTRNRLTAVALAAACANGAFAMDVAGFEFNGYSRGGPVFNHSDGVKGNLSLGGELQKYRLGNEGDNGIEVNFARGFEAGGVKWKVNYMPAKWGSGDISTEQAFVEMSGFSFSPEAKFWVGQRRLRIQDVHIVDYFLLNYGDNIGAGVTDVPVGGMKLGLGVFTGDKFDGGLPNNVKAHRINADLSEINTNPGGKLRVLLTAVGARARSMAVRARASPSCTRKRNSCCPALPTRCTCKHRGAMRASTESSRPSRAPALASAPPASPTPSIGKAARLVVRPSLATRPTRLI